MPGKAINSKTQVILFDHDGTLIDSEAVHFTLWQSILVDYGITLTAQFYNEVMAGIPVKQNAIDLVRHFNIRAKPEALAEQKHACVRQYLAERAFPLMPFAKEAIIACHDAGYTVGIVTGGATASVARTLDTYGLGAYVSVVVAVEDVEHSKPAPDCYLKAMRQLHVNAAQCVAVEDTAHGLQAAVAAGIATVAVPTAQSAKHDFSHASSRYVSLKDWLENELIPCKGA